MGFVPDSGGIVIQHRRRDETPQEQNRSGRAMAEPMEACGWGSEPRLM